MNTPSAAYYPYAQKTTCYAYWVFALASMFYLYEFALQVSMSVMFDPMMADLKVESFGFGALSAAYYLAYTPMQLPAGLLYDRFGPRRLITIATLICSMGAVFFAVTNGVVMVALGRFFMGIGSAFAFIGVLVLLARWFPPYAFALMAGIAQTMSSVGAVSGEIPLAAMVESVGWRNSMLWMAGIGFLLSILIWRGVRDAPEGYVVTTPNHQKSNEWQRLKAVCGNFQTWAVAIYAFAVWAPILIFAALWGVTYLEELYAVDGVHASIAMAMVWIGIGVGSPFLGWLSDRIGRRCLPLTLATISGILSTLGIVYLGAIPEYLMWILLFFLGFAAGGQTVTFAVVKENNRADHVGTASGFNNMAVVAGGILFQPLVGYLLERFWDFTKAADGTPIYSVAAFQKAFILLPLCYVVALVMSAFFIRETHARDQVRS